MHSWSSYTKMEMNQQNERETRASLFFPLGLLFIMGICGLYVWATQSIRPLYDLSRDKSIPFSINATKTADYSPDYYTPVGNISLNIIFDLFQDLDPASAPENRMATLVGSLQTPVSSVTIPAGSTQVDSTVQVTPLVETTVPEIAITEATVVVILDTPAPSTSTVAPPPPPPSKPKPTKEELPPTPIPATPIPSATPEPAHFIIINPSSDGATITGNDETMFEVEAWDPAVGTTNGDGITSIAFTLYDSMGNTLHTYTDVTSSYCAFGGDSSCSDSASAGLTLRDDTYTLEVTMLTDAGETKTIMRTFVIPIVTHLDTIVPPTDGTVIMNMADTKFEAEAWDTTVGINNGDGITSVTFTLYDSIGNTILTYPDIASLYCAFGGDVVCSNSASAGITLNSDTYTLEATVLTDAGDTSTVTRTFIIP